MEMTWLLGTLTIQVIFCYFHHWKSVADDTSLCTRGEVIWWCGGGVAFLVVRMASLSLSLPLVYHLLRNYEEHHHHISPLFKRGVICN